jgi:hypothetical protein
MDVTYFNAKQSSTIGDIETPNSKDPNLPLCLLSSEYIVYCQVTVLPVSARCIHKLLLS